MKPVFLAVVAGLAVSACATEPEMQRASGRNATGYREQAIEIDRYRVQYRLDSRFADKADDFVLLRAAELTLEKGRRTFEIVSRNSDTDRRETMQPVLRTERDVVLTRSCGLVTCQTQATPVWRDTVAYEPRETGATRVVSIEILLSDQPANGKANVYDAASVAKSLRPHG